MTIKIIFTLSFFIGGGALATAPLSKLEVLRYQDCQIDTDCVYAQNGSCDCNNGGVGVAIAKTKVEDFKKKFEPTTCTEIKGASCRAGQPRCENNKCLYYYVVLPHVYTGKKKD